ncbi:MAG: ABC transporter permease subunit [Oscillospiraceae bacterium]|nr:ABC transporter permease subunit [Oscillospiraceae bacterium]
MKTSTTRHRLFRSLGAVAFWLAVWWAVSAAVGQPLILPGPPETARALAELSAGPAFWTTVGLTLLRIACGFLAGAAAGALLALGTAFSPLLSAVFSPVMRLVRSTPVASFIILALLWVAKAAIPALISAMLVAPVIWGGVSAALAGTDRELLEMARAYRFGRWKTLRSVYIPSAMPAFSASCLTAVGLAWKSGVAAEVLCQLRPSVGAELYYAKIYLETPRLFAWTAAVVVLSYLLEKFVAAVLRKGAGA